MDTVESDERVRTVLLNGSRANPKIEPDQYQDFDLVFVVSNFNSFISDHSWTNVFGEKLIWQLPDEMIFGEKDLVKHQTKGFHYLMLFRDGTRIDLTLFPVEKWETDFVLDSLTIIWLDKDNLFPKVPISNDSNYHISKPTEKYFLDVCNEFWWVTTYVAKGLLRSEITYAKEMLETTLRPMFMKMIEWSIGTKTSFSVSFGKGGRFMKQYLSGEQHEMILATYSDQQVENNWKSLFIMAELFSEFAVVVADSFNFRYNLDEQQNVITYLRTSFSGQA